MEYGGLPPPNNPKALELADPTNESFGMAYLN
jgi:hypothetical protein